MDKDALITPTLRDVAARAGVSISTASRVLTSDPRRRVARETQDVVWQAARDLRYAPNQAAQHLVRRTAPQENHTGNLGLVLGDLTYKFADSYWSVVVEGVDNETRYQGYHLRFTFTLQDLQQGYQLRLLSRDYIDGLILVGGTDSLSAMGAFKDQIIAAVGRERTVMIEGGDDRVQWAEPLLCDVVTIDKRRGMHKIVDHLVSLGYRRFAFLGPPLGLDERASAVAGALATHGLSLAPEPRRPTPWFTDEAYPVALEALRASPRPQAVICANDAIAVATLRAARACGLRVPHDLAITGFDDIAFARDLDPPLTTVHVPKQLVGETAVRRLIERIARPALPPIIQVVPTALIVRRSCGAAAREEVPSTLARSGAATG